MTARNNLVTQFENALSDLIEIHMRDGLSPDEVQLVLRTRADDDYHEFARMIKAADVTAE